MSKAKSPDGQPDRPPLALIAGPTASGKSDLALRLALALQEQRQRAVIVNADSAQVYSDLAVLSARPSQAETEGIEHRLFGAWDGATPCSAADWAEAARSAICEAYAAEVVPILVGGTGLYLRTLLDGIAPIPPIDPDIRAAVRALPQPEARAALLREDPDRALELAPADAARTTRALEVIRSTGRTLADWQREPTGGIGQAVTLHARILLPDRAWLYERCDRRFASMLDGGAIAEVEALLARGLDPDLPVMRAIGVAPIARYLAGACSLDDAREAGAQATRNYAKRQYTWFRRQPPREWARIDAIDINERAAFEILLQH